MFNFECRILNMETNQCSQDILPRFCAPLARQPGVLFSIFVERRLLAKSAKKRTSHAWCNACDAHFRRVLHRICYSNVAQMKRASCVQHTCRLCAGCCSGSMRHTRVTRVGCALLSRVCHPFMYCRCRALLACRKCAGPWVTFGQ
jgi:hypothetical protein